ncbi:chloramphenicol acetyltransferase [Flavobacterium amniphilum]|uniref:chloramphenicol acetyltransferase n=1 Tax=Flavobacterium amniphilum TaxID=1834035 RepID=UPI00202AB532|nr:chloramphenicol acetyltransferase [Flavobacterium amniphilum]MCL9804019.1 chloramphenicol acetyltransferase [Flavobacterium amniphilum]
MKHKLDVNNWNRKEHFEFFSQMEEPFFGFTIPLDCTEAYQKAKDLDMSFFIYYLHKTLVSVNAIECFRYRIENGEVFVYDKINVSATIMREDKTFGFSFIEFDEDIQKFNLNAKNEIERIQNTTGLFTREFNDVNLIHFSAVPWINFSGVSHARGFSYPDSCPKIAFGEMTEDNGKKTMPFSIHAHHGLMDGYHVGLFLERMKAEMQ